MAAVDLRIARYLTRIHPRGRCDEERADTGRLEKLELFFYSKALAVVAVTHAFRDNLIGRGIDAAKIHVVTNSVDTSRFKPMPKDPELMQSLGLQGKFVAGYVGTHGMAHGLHTLIDAALLLRDDPACADVRILMLGDGTTRAELEARAVADGATNILFLDNVAKEQVAGYWSLLDVAIIHLKKSPLFTTVIPSKMFECMGMRIPILHGVEGESAGIVRQNDIGLTFEPDNAAALVAGLKAARLYDRHTLAMEMLTVMSRYARHS